MHFIILDNLYKPHEAGPFSKEEITLAAILIFSKSCCFNFLSFLSSNILKPTAHCKFIGLIRTFFPKGRPSLFIMK